MSDTVFITDREGLEKAISEAVRKAMMEALPEALREAQDKEWLNRDEVRARYGLTPRQLTYMRTKGSVEYSKHGRRVLYNRNRLEAWIERGKVQTSPTY